MRVSARCLMPNTSTVVEPVARLIVPTAVNGLNPLTFKVDAQGMNQHKSTTVFCTGLGTTWNHSFAIDLQKYCVARHSPFARFEYRLSTPWCVASWITDLVQLIDRFYTLTERRVNLIAISAGAQAALRAALERPEKVGNLVLVQPGVGINIDFIERALPGSLDKLRCGHTVWWPDSLGQPSIELSYRNLIAYTKACPVNRSALGTIDLPGSKVAILHGLNDRLVPFDCAVKLAQKLKCQEVDLRLVPDFPHKPITKMNPPIRDLVESYIVGRDRSDTLLTDDDVELLNIDR